MDTRKITMQHEFDYEPSYLVLDGRDDEDEAISVPPNVGHEVASELVRRWNSFPALIEALEGLVQTIEFQAEANFLNEDAEEGEENALTRARAALKAASE